jgi:hypothetical protein
MFDPAGGPVDLLLGARAEQKARELCQGCPSQRLDAGYYPYVTQCNTGWQAVPAS